MHHVVLGAGPAGVVACETLRKHDPSARITLVAGEGEPPYSRMAIPYLLAGNIEEQGTYLRPYPDHYQSIGVDVVQGRAGGIDSRGQKLFLSGGEALAYDRLLLATGATPTIPPIEGAGLEGVHTCWTLKDARKIIELADRDAPVVLVGAGFIGSIILEALVNRGVKLTVVEMADRMVARMMDETAGAMLTKWCEDKGVRVMTRDTVQQISRNGSDLSVKLAGGTELPAKLVVLAAGVRSNTGFLVDSGVTVNNGVLVGAHMQTSVENIYAAGDVAEACDLSSGSHDVLAIQPVAVEHARLAALNMAGIVTPHEGSLNMNVLDTLGLVSASFGSWMGVVGGDSARLVDPDGPKYLRLEFRGARLVGAQSVGMTDQIGMMRGLIQTGRPLGEWKTKLLKSPERLREAYVAMAEGIAA